MHSYLIEMAIPLSQVDRYDIPYRNLHLETTPTLYYARIQSFFDPTKEFSVWTVFNQHLEAIQLQRQLAEVLGERLSGELALGYHTHLSVRKALLVTDISHCNISDWYLAMHNEFVASGSPPNQWLSIIIVIVCQFNPSSLASWRELMKVTWKLHFPGAPAVLRSYLLRLHDICVRIRDRKAAQNGYFLNFTFEDPLFWTERERFDFLSKLTFQL